MMFKKGQGISLNVVVVAAIALIVLVVLVLIFTGRLAIFTGEVDDVTGSTCNTFTGPDDSPGIWLVGASCPEGYTQILTAEDAKDNIGKSCCVATQ